MVEREIGLFEALYSQRAIRSLRPDPVPEDMLRRIVEAGTKAPSGSNRQMWSFVVVTDPALIGRIAELVRDQFGHMYEQALARMQPGDEMPFPRLKPLVETFEKVPAVIFPCSVRPEGSPKPTNPMAGASIYPAVQNMLLAARGLGIGSVLTTMGLAHEDKIKELLGVPDNVDLMATLPLGYPDKERYGSTTRRPVSEVTHWNRWGALQE